MVNSKGEIKAKATVKGIEYEVIQTKKGSGNVWGARDTIRNNTTGQSKEMTRKEWKELFDKYK